MKRWKLTFIRNQCNANSQVRKKKYSKWKRCGHNLMMLTNKCLYIIARSTYLHNATIVQVVASYFMVKSWARTTPISWTSSRHISSSSGELLQGDGPNLFTITQNFISKFDVKIPNLNQCLQIIDVLCMHRERHTITRRLTICKLAPLVETYM